MGSIPLSPKHGVNPSMSMCFWCGKEKNEIALLGKLKGDKEAPPKIVVDYEPCDVCKELFSQGIQIAGFTEEPLVPGMFPIVQTETMTLYPTGCMFVASEEWTKGFLTANEQESMIDSVLNKRQLLLPNQVVMDIVKDIKQEDEEGEQKDADN